MILTPYKDKGGNFISRNYSKNKVYLSKFYIFSLIILRGYDIILFN